MKTAPLRVAGRIAWRSARRNVRRSVLIVVMIGLPVALVTAAATVARTTVPTPEDQIARAMGAADLVLSPGNRFDPHRLRERLPNDSDVVTIRFEEASLIQGGALVNALLLEPDAGLDSSVLHGLYELQSGRGPRGAGDVALHAGLLMGFDAQVGDEVELSGHALTVTGVARYPQDLDHHIAVVGQGTLPAHAPISSVLIALPSGTSIASLKKALKRAGMSAWARHDLDAVVSDAADWDAVSLVGGALALFGTGLIAAAAFVVGARRQLRELGVVGAIGGEPRHVRAVVWLSGTMLGLVGGVLGSVLGVGVAYAVRPFLDGLVGRVVGPVDINVFVLIGAVVMGTTAATLAAFAPARAAGKLSVMAALAGRTLPPRPPGRIAGLGFVIVVLGGVVTAWSTISDQNVLLAAGLIAMLLGVLLAIPLLVSLVGRVATRFPTTGRMAARDAARHGRRTGAAVAAAVIALCVPIAVSTYSLSEETYERRSPRLGDDQLLIGALDDFEPAETGAVAADFREAFPAAMVVPLTKAVLPPSRRGSIRDSVPVFAGVTEEPGPRVTTVTAWELFIADTDLLRAVHAEAGAEALADGKALTLGGFRPNKGFVRILDRLPRGATRGRKLAAVAVHSPPYFNESIPRIVISSAVARDFGFREDMGQYLLTGPSALSSDDIQRARKVAGDHPGFYVNSAEDYLPRYALARAAATAVSLPLALVILAVAVALVVSESGRSHQILVAVGAGPVTHRKVVAATSGLLALIAAILAVPAGLLPTVVVQVASQAGRPVVVPWQSIAIVVLITPALSGAAAGLVARSPGLGSLLNPSV